MNIGRKSCIRLLGGFPTEIRAAAYGSKMQHDPGQYSSVGKALEWEPGDVGSNPSPGPSQLCDLGEITLPLHLRSWPENEEFGVML